MGQKHSVSSVQFTQSCLTLQPHRLQHTRLPCPSPTPGTCSWHQVSDAIQPSHPLWSPSPPAFNHSQYQSFPVSQFFTAGGPKYWSFSFSSSPSNEYSGLISFRMYWLDLLAVQSTLKSLFQHHVSKATTLWHLAFFIVQLSHPYLTIRKP